jgi:hypothetical protein
MHNEHAGTRHPQRCTLPCPHASRTSLASISSPTRTSCIFNTLPHATPHARLLASPHLILEGAQLPPFLWTQLYSSGNPATSAEIIAAVVHFLYSASKADLYCSMVCFPGLLYIHFLNNISAVLWVGVLDDAVHVWCVGGEQHSQLWSEAIL